MPKLSELSKKQKEVLKYLYDRNDMAYIIYTIGINPSCIVVDKTHTNKIKVSIPTVVKLMKLGLIVEGMNKKNLSSYDCYYISEAGKDLAKQI